MKSKIVATYSGGSTKFVCLGVGCYELYKAGIRPTDVSGISSGALAALVSALGVLDESLFEKSIELGKNITLNDIFPPDKIAKILTIPNSPVSDSGSFRIESIFRILSGFPAFGIQNLNPLFDKILEESLFLEFQKSSKTPNVWIVAVEPKNMSHGIWNLKDKSISFSKAKDILSASSHIPAFAQPVKIDGKLYVDGGLRNHNPSPIMIKKYQDQISELYSFYTRPHIVDLWEAPDWADNVISVLMRILEGMSMEISKRDSEYEKTYEEIFQYKLCNFFYPRIMKSQYSTDKKDLYRLAEESKKISEEVLNNFLNQ